MSVVKRRRRPTLAVVAREAGVSIGTASNILGAKATLHSSETVERVLQAARRLGYRPNRIARSLAARRSQTIGIVMEPTHAVFTRNEYATAVLDGVVDRFTPEGYHIKIITLRDLNPRTLWAQIDDGTIDGAILIAPLIGSPLLEWHEHTHLPCVVVGSALPESMGFYCVDSDSEGMITEVVRWLVGLGHRRIGFVQGPEEQWSARQRERAYRQAMAAHGIKVCPDWLARGFYTQEGGRLAAEQLLQVCPPLTAIIASNDPMALGVLEACRQQGVCVPDDLSVVGFDDMPLAALANPPLTTVRNPIHEIGYHAAQALLEQITTGEAKRGNCLIPGELIIRQSVAPLKT
ncbi:MAG: LacI family transcriptional regulator [Fimbriimonadales bacterium]|nr:LacI family transcriptional regulator [Fimbriimonadales bacterium]